jgi:GNAT superfamily N-acetyltransferase
VLVACDDVDPDVLHGFIAFDEPERVVDYLYVKKAMRGFGVAQQLVQDATRGWCHKSCTVLPKAEPLRSG